LGSGLEVIFTKGFLSVSGGVVVLILDDFGVVKPPLSLIGGVISCTID